MKWHGAYSWLVFLFVAINVHSQNLNFSGGATSSVLLCKDGHVYVSGANDYGQLGRGFLSGIMSPDIVSGIGGFGTLTHIKQVAGKQDVTVIALSSTGDSVITWGNNGRGQLGSNLYGNGGANNNKFPYRVVGVAGAGYLTGVKYVNMGTSTGYAVLNNGKVVAWGSGGFGALGNGTNGPDMVSPVYVLKGPGDTLKNVLSVAAGNECALAILSDGSLWAWGQNDRGQLGQNTNTVSLYAIPVKGKNGVGFLTNIVSVSCSENHVMALSNTDTTWAWGDNNNGQLGNNTNTNSWLPVVTLNSTGSGPLRNVRAIATGFGFSMALRSDSTVSVWGNNSNGRFGNNTTISSLIPTKVLDQFGGAPLKNIIQISTGKNFAFAQRINGMLWAWGDNSQGQLAVGDNIERHLPDTVTEPCLWVKPPVFVKGTISGPSSICGVTNSGTITLAGQTGSVVAWHTSNNNFVNYTSTSSTSQTFNFTNITQKTSFRALIQFNDQIFYSDSMVVQVSPLSVPGTLGSPATVCATSNSGTLTLTGYTGTITGWESSVDSFATAGVPFANTNPFYNYTNLSSTQYYRVAVKSGGCPALYSTIVKITVNPVSVGGTISSPASTTICASSNGATLTLSGNTGNITRWEYSTDGFSSSNTIVNNTNTYNYLNLATNTQYRAVVTSGSCALAYSSVYSVSVDQPTVVGTLGSPATVCSGSNSGSLSLSGYVGSVIQWESSLDNFSTNTVISNITSSQPYSNLTATTSYRLLIQNGVCPSSYSGIVKITVDALSVGGTISSPAPTTICASSNGATLTLSGNTGNITRWEYSTDGFSSSNTIVNSTNTYNYLNLTTNTQYRAVVTSGSCALAYSSVYSVSVDQPTVVGTLGSPATVCSGSNSGSLSLSGFVGSVIQWESSLDNFSTNTVISNTSSSQPYSNLTATTSYRLLIQNGVCPSAYSGVVKITVDNMTVPGDVGPTSSVCFGTNSGAMTLTGQTGNILRWEYSSDNFSFFINPITNTTTTNNFSNLTVTTYYRAVVQSGVCAQMNSTVNIITVDPVSASGALAPSASVVCSGSNTGLHTLSSQVGNVIGWESSTDNFTTITPITNTTLTNTYTNLTATTSYRVKIQSGVCPFVYSPVATVTVTPLSVAGTLGSSSTVCSGVNGATLLLSTQTGAILRWEHSTDGFVSSIDTIINNTNSYNYSNLTTTSYYRVRVKNGICPGIFSNVVTIAVDVPSVPGTLGSPVIVCSGSNAGTLTLSGPTVGSIVQWQSSTNNFVSINPIANSTASNPYSNITTTTRFRVVVKNGACPSTFSNIVEITVDPVSSGGTLASAASVCSGSNSGVLTLSGSAGAILQWESSPDPGFATIDVITNNGLTNNYFNLLSTTYYRTVVKSGVCPAVYSSSVTITVYPVSAAGVINSPDTVCFGFNTGTLTLPGGSFTGNILHWEKSTDNFATTTIIANITSSETYTNLVATTYYRVQVQNGACPSVYSPIVEITVNPNSVGGTITGSDTVCVSSNGGTLKLGGYLGTVVQWETSTDNFATVVVPVSNNSDDFNYSSLTTTTYFRAQIQNTGCAIAYPSPAVVKVDPVSVGGTLTAPAVVCANANAGVIKLASYTGDVLQWQTSNDNFATNTPVANSTDSIEYLNLSNTTFYRVNIKSGVCPAIYSNVTAVTVNPASAGGNILGAQNVCIEGNGNQLFLTNQSGDILQWETSTNNFATSNIIPNTTAFYSYLNLTSPLSVRVLVQQSPCPAVYSNVFNFIINPATVGGIITGNGFVQKGESSGPLTLVNFTGGVIEWEYSADTSLGWNSLPVTSNVHSFPEMDTSIYVRVRVKSGNCIDRLSSVFYIRVVNEINTDIKIYPTISPNADQINDEWYIENITLYPSNQVRIYNRWGDTVFEIRGYDNSGKVWRGQSNTHLTVLGQDLPEGTYFYVVDPGNGKAQFSGYVVLNR